MFVPTQNKKISSPQKEQMTAMIYPTATGSDVVNAMGEEARYDPMALRGVAKGMAVDIAEDSFGIKDFANPLTAPWKLAAEGLRQIYDTDTTPVTEDEWKQSDSYREGLDWHEGMTVSSARIIARQEDRRVKNEIIIANARGAGTAMGMVNALGTSLVDPLTAVAGYGAIGALAKVGTTFPKMASISTLHNIGKEASLIAKFKAGLVSGVAEGTLTAAMLEPVARYSAERIQADYDINDTLMNFGSAVAFPLILGGAGLAMRSTLKGVGKAGSIIKSTPKSTIEGEAIASFDKAIQQTVSGEPLNPEVVHYEKLMKERANLESELNIQQDKLDSVFERAGMEEVNKRYDLEQQREARLVGLDKEQIANIKANGYDVSDVVSAINYVKRTKASQDAESKLLLKAIRRQGGINFQKEILASELEDLGFKPRQMPGMVNKKGGGVTLDELGEILSQELALPYRPDVNEVLERLTREINQSGDNKAAELAYINESERFLNEVGIDTKGLRKRSTKDIDAEIERLKQPSLEESEISSRINQINKRLSEMPSFEEMKEKIVADMESQASNQDVALIDYFARNQDDYQIGAEWSANESIHIKKLNELIEAKGITEPDVYFAPEIREEAELKENMRKSAGCFV